MIVTVIFAILAIGITISSIITAFIESAIKNPKKYNYSSTDPVLTGLTEHFSDPAIKIIFRILMIFFWPYIVCIALFGKKIETAPAE